MAGFANSPLTNAGASFAPDAARAALSAREPGKEQA